MSLRERERDKEPLQNNLLATRYNRLRRSFATRGLGAVVVLALLVLTAGCGLPIHVRQQTTTTPFATPVAKRPLTIYAGTYHGWVYAVSSTGGQVRWHATDAVWPVLANGVLYTASGPGLVQALSPADGTVRWHVQIIDQPNRAIAMAPIINHGVIYVTLVGFNGVPFGEVDALSAANGSVLWRFNTHGNSFHISPVVADGIIYAGTDALYTLRASDGHLIRRIETDGYFYTKPAIQAGIAYITINEAPPGRGSAVEAIRVADGMRLWRKHSGDGAPRDLLVIGDDVYASGFIDTNAAGTPGTDGTASGYGLLYALHSSDSSVQWTFRASGGFDTSPAIRGNILYAGSGDGYLNLIDRSTGTLLRRYRIDDGQSTAQPHLTYWTTPVVRDGVIYFAFRAFDRLYVFHADGPAGHVFAMRERDGAILWETDLVGWVSALQMSAA